MIALLLALFDARAQDPEEDLIELDAPPPTAAPTEEHHGLFGRKERKERNDAREHTIHGLPLRMDMGAAFRTELSPAFIVSLGAQLARSKSFALETNFGFEPLHGFQYAGPWRTMGSWSLSADATWLASRWLAIGPSGGVDYRMFSQQGSAIEQMFVPVVGGRLNTAFIRGRTWSFAITTRVFSDLSLTRIVLETSQVRIMPLVEGQIGLRFNLGHGKIPGEQQ